MRITYYHIPRSQNTPLRMTDLDISQPTVTWTMELDSKREL